MHEELQMGIMIFSCFPAVIKLPWVGRLPKTPYLAVMTLQRVSVLTVMAAAMWQGHLAVLAAGSPERWNGVPAGVGRGWQHGGGEHAGAALLCQCAAHQGACP